MTNPFEEINSRLNSIENSIKSIEMAITLINTKLIPQPEKKFYSIKEAAEKLNVAQITLYRNTENGKVPSKRIGDRVFIPSSFIENV